MSYMSAAAISRSPSGPTRRYFAPSAIMTGTPSLELTAQHLGLPGAVQHVSPPHFRQWLMARRHS